MPIAELPDGTEVEFPDGTPMPVMEAHLSSLWRQMGQAQPTQAQPKMVGSMPAEQFRALSPQQRQEASRSMAEQYHQQGALQGDRIVQEAVAKEVLSAGVTAGVAAATGGISAAGLLPRLGIVARTPIQRLLAAGLSKAIVAAPAAVGGSLVKSQIERSLDFEDAPKDTKELLSRAGSEGLLWAATEVAAPLGIEAGRRVLRLGVRALVKGAEATRAGKAHIGGLEAMDETFKRAAKVKEEAEASIKAKAEEIEKHLEMYRQKIKDGEEAVANDSLRKANEIKYRMETEREKLKQSYDAAEAEFKRSLENHKLRAKDLSVEIEKDKRLENLRIGAEQVAEAISKNEGARISSDDTSVLANAAKKTFFDMSQEIYGKVLDKVAGFADQDIKEGLAKLSTDILTRHRSIPHNWSGVTRAFNFETALERRLRRGAEETLSTLQKIQDGSYLMSTKTPNITIKDLVWARGQASMALRESEDKVVKGYLEEYVKGIDDIVENSFRNNGESPELYRAAKKFWGDRADIIKGGLYTAMAPDIAVGSTKRLSQYISTNTETWNHATAILSAAGRADLIPQLRRDFVEGLLRDKNGTIDLIGFYGKYQDHKEVLENVMRTQTLVGRGMRKGIQQGKLDPDALFNKDSLQTLVDFSSQYRKLSEPLVDKQAKLDSLNALMGAIEKKIASHTQKAQQGFAAAARREAGLIEGWTAQAQKSRESLRALREKESAMVGELDVLGKMSRESAQKIEQMIADQKAANVASMQKAQGFPSNSFSRIAGSVTIMGASSLAGLPLSGSLLAGAIGGAALPYAANRVSPLILTIAANPQASHLLSRGLRALNEGAPTHAWAPQVIKAFHIGLSINKARELQNQVDAMKVNQK